MEQQTPKTSRRPRADSLRNRERLLEAAHEVFGGGGEGASLESVARAAGVGIGTLYRHFPTREALFQAAYRREVDQLVAFAEELASDPAPTEALRRWLHAAVAMVATKKGMLAALEPAPGTSADLYADSSARQHAAVATLIARAAAAGEIRTDIGAEDTMRALIAICYMRDVPDWQPTVLRLVDVFVDGLRTRTGG
jgi:AcrR family transcriptional regulator